MLTARARPTGLPQRTRGGEEWHNRRVGLDVHEIIVLFGHLDRELR
ncbi:MAG: hypothetical protein HQL88_07545 [Magnetococcales bacterium]|nr:hypothetical protein [Magnetococcales bacterium]